MSLSLQVSPAINLPRWKTLCFVGANGFLQPGASTIPISKAAIQMARSYNFI
jgi:hypothetical protein